MPAAEEPVSITRLNLQIAELVKKLDPADLVEALSGRAAWLVGAEDQNQNQNGSRLA